MDNQVQTYFLEKDYNCAEAVLHILNDRYCLGLSDEDYHLVSGFGGGCGCGHICGALAGCMAALGRLKVETRAHVTPNFKENCAGLYSRFEQTLGAADCAELKPRYFKEGIRCAELLEIAVAEFDRYCKDI